MTQFQTDKLNFTYLLDLIDNGHLALPDFQRSFVWAPDATRELVASVVQSFPAGTLLLIQGGAHLFKPRSFEGSPPLKGTPTQLVLDGQQRLTSLYQAFTGVGTHRFFLNVRELIDGHDVDEAVEVYTERRAAAWATTTQQAAALMLPLNRVRQFGEWKDEVLDWTEQHNGSEAKKALRAQLNRINDDFVKPIEAYQFPLTILSESTSAAAVCTIFETLNRTGVKLSVFELWTARAFAHDVHLRDRWAASLEQHPIIEEFDVDPYYVLQAISVRAKGSAKRSAVLALDVQEVVGQWDRVVAGLADALSMLRSSCGVLVEKLLPNRPMLITLAAVWPRVAELTGPARGAAKAKLRRWFWCSAFAGTYENSSNSRAESDVLLLTKWIAGGEPPDLIAKFSFDAERLRDVTGRQKSQYAATLALLTANGALDFHEATKLTPDVIAKRGVDDHHVFPRGWFKQNSIAYKTDTVLNHALIDRTTNQRIGKRAPSDYLAEMRAHLGDDFERVLGSHTLPAEADGPLLSDDFDGFLRWRIEQIATLLQQAVAKSSENHRSDS